MKKLLFLFIGISPILQAQKKAINLQDIWTYNSFKTDYMNSLNSMNGDFYSLLNYNPITRSSTVDVYSYQTLKKVKTVVDSKNLVDLAYFSSYSFNYNETKLILGTHFKKRYRHSYTGTFYVYDIASKKISLIDKNIQKPTFSPDSKKIAYTKNNNLFVKDLTSEKTTQITFDGQLNKIINGTTDWVYEEEFSFVKAFAWNKTGNYIAFLRFDESSVPKFSMDIYGKSLYPTQQVFKYPKAGEQNSKVSLYLYNFKKKSTQKINLNNYEYIPRIKWTNKKNILSVITLNRHQNNLNLIFINAKSGSSRVILNEQDDAYIDINDHLTFLKDNSFIWTSEKDGYNHIYHYKEDGRFINQITKGNWEVTNYYGYNKSKQTIYYQSTENGTINRGVYSIHLDGKNKKLLSNPSGTNDASFSKNRNYFINTFSNAKTPPIYSLYKADGHRIKIIKDNNALKQKIAHYNISPKEFSTIVVNGNKLNMWMIKPANFDSSKQYPLLMYQYSGPGSQEVANTWNTANDYWYQMLAQKGYIVACVDGRGTGFKGRNFKKITYKELGKYEVEDQIASAKKLATRTYIDNNRIGIWGWSYGGFMSTNCILKGNDIFSMAIAVAPVTSWRFYDTIYTERYMQTPQENPLGYDENSPINYAKNLKGKYLLIHGTGDDNVHVQNTMRMINALLNANKQFDLFLYPDRTHGIYKGNNTRLHLYTKMTRFIQANL